MTDYAIINTYRNTILKNGLIMTLKNLYKVMLAVMICTANNFTLTTEPDAQELAASVDNRGRDRVFTIMYDGDHGVNEYNKKITYAKTANLTQDIALADVAQYFPTKTPLGEKLLLDTLVSVVSPQDTNKTIKNRQHAIKALTQNPQFRDEVTDLLHQADTHIKSVMKLMIDRDDVVEKIKIPNLSDWGFAEPFVKPWYLGKRYIQTSPWIKIFSQGGQSATALGLLMGAMYQKKQAMKGFAETNTWINPEFITNLNNFTSSISDNSSLNDKMENYYKYKHTFLFTGEAISTLQYTFGSIGSAFSAYGIGQSIYDEHQTGLQNRLLIHSLYILINIAQKLEDLYSQHDIHLQFTTDAITDPEGIAMIKELQNPRYTSPDTLLVATPWVTTFLNEIYEQDTHLAPYFALIAEVDMYHAFAQKIIENKDSVTPLCFAEKLNESRPRFTAHKCWNTVVQNPIPNDLSEDRKIILTGPNAGGKSTIMRSILQNIILGQTFGIATGESFAATHYDIIHSYLGVTDDIKHGLSRYMAELNLASDIVAIAASLKNNEKFFFIIDELFTSTGGQYGEAIAYEFINEDLAPFSKNVQYIFATHFEKLKEIGILDDKTFALYKINAPVKNEAGTFVYPFTISPGVSNINIAQELKWDAGLRGKQTQYNNPKESLAG